jgi:hypothetical protein
MKRWRLVLTTDPNDADPVAPTGIWYLVLSILYVSAVAFGILVNQVPSTKYQIPNTGSGLSRGLQVDEAGHVSAFAVHCMGPYLIEDIFELGILGHKSCC